jgi:hypothetical protein
MLVPGHGVVGVDLAVGGFYGVDALALLWSLVAQPVVSSNQEAEPWWLPSGAIVDRVPRRR